MSGGQVDWGGRLPKSNGGAQRFPQNGWKSFAERKDVYKRQEQALSGFIGCKGYVGGLISLWFKPEA